MKHKLNRWVVAQHPKMDTVLLAFGNEVDEVPEYGFSLRPEDAVEIGEELVKIGKRMLATPVVAEEPQDPDYQEHVNGD
jgi:hypothetical protein